MFSMHAKEVTPAQEPKLHEIVDRLCLLANMEKPRVGVAEMDIPNAFATGRSPKHAVICATRGLMQRLNDEELEAVLAHELSHVAHRDVAVMTIASAWACSPDSSAAWPCGARCSWRRSRSRSRRTEHHSH